MKLVLHIGTPKTASTFLQNTLAGNRDWLRQRGIIYPDLRAPDANHITLFYVSSPGIHDFARDYGVKTQDDRLKLRADLSKHLGQQIVRAPAGCHTAVLSSENLTGNLRGPKGLQALHDFLAPHFDEIKVLIYLRRQDDALLSMYGEFMRRGFSDASFQAFSARSMGPETTTPHLYYRRMLSQWIAVFGREAITPRLFDRSFMQAGDVLVDFMTQVFGTPAGGVDVSGMTRSENDNVGLSAPVLEFLRLMYPHIPFRKDNQFNPKRAELMPRINALPAEPRPRMSAQRSEKIMQHFEPANVWLHKTFFPDREGPLFPPRENLEDRGNLGQITLDDFAQLTGKLFL